MQDFQGEKYHAVIVVVSYDQRLPAAQGFSV
jgi:hypothetical protein